MGEFRRRQPREIEREIARARTELVASVQALELGVRARLGWRHYVRQRPLATVGAALAIGIILGLRL